MIYYNYPSRYGLSHNYSPNKVSNVPYMQRPIDIANRNHNHSNQYLNQNNQYLNHQKRKNGNSNSNCLQTSSRKDFPKEKLDCDNNIKDAPIFEIFGIKLYFDDILLICLIFFLYTEGVEDQYLFIALILLLLS